MFSVNLLLRLLAVLVLVTNFGISGYFRRQANRSGGDLDPAGNRLLLLLRVGALTFLLPFLINLFLPGLFGWTLIRLPLPLQLFGAGLAISSIPAIYWLFSTIGTNISPSHTTREDHELITFGPYRYIRHPLYTFGLSAFIGIGLMVGSWWLILGLAVMGSVILYRTPLEEAALIDLFGKKYIDYIDQTGRYFPKILN